MGLIKSEVARSFIKSNWKTIAGGVAGIALVVGFVVWKDHVEDAAYDKGYSAAENVFSDRVEAANRRAAADQKRLDAMTVSFGKLSQGREQAVKVNLQPIIERIESEVASDPVYRDCVVSDGVLGDRRSGRAAVNASIAASNPVPDRP